MADAPAFTKLVPGFEFLQGLVENAGAAMPGIGQWVAPTLNPEELEKRIGELRTVQFWLEQNARLLATTIQALEVQRMTLATLKTMNVQMDDLRESLQVRRPAAAQSDTASRGQPDPTPHAAAAPGAVDPMQWWGALTQQFTQLAASAMKDRAEAAAPKAPAASAPGADAPQPAPAKPAAAAAAKAVRKKADAARKPRAGTA